MPLRKRNLFLMALTFVAALLLTANVWADSATFTGTNGVYTDSVVFSQIGNTLTITLTNTSAADVLVPTDVLTAVLFHSLVAGTPVSASLVPGDTVWYGSLSNVGDGWGYGFGVSANGENTAITATGAVNGIGDANFDPAVCVTPSDCPLNGLDYGLLSAGDNPATGNHGVTQHGPLIRDSAQFALAVPSGFHIVDMGTTVVFQYGTALSEFHFTSDTYSYNPYSPGQSPEPGTLIMLGTGVVGLAGVLRRKLNL